MTEIVTQRLDVVASYGHSEMLHNLSTISCTINRYRDIDIVSIQYTYIFVNSR